MMTAKVSTALFVAGCALTTAFFAGGRAQEAARSPIEVSSVTVTIEGTSRRDPFVASTKAVYVTRLQLSEPRSQDVLQQALRPGGLEAFDVTIPVMTLASPDEGVAAHVHESLKADAHPEIRFQLRAVKVLPDDGMGFIRRDATGMLTVAGVEREVTLTIAVLRAGRWLLLEGNTDLLMTDFGVTPPKGFLGLLKTDPTIRVRFYLTVAATDN